MEMKLIIGSEAGAMSPKEEVKKESPKEFPTNSTWKEESTKLLKEAYDICAKGDGPEAMEVCDAIQTALDILGQKKEEEPEEDIMGMKESKKDYMDKFQEDGQSDETK